MVDDLRAANPSIVDGPAMHGRQQEWAALRDALAAARQGHGALALVSGEAGIGKTTLVAALVREASARGVPVLSGTSYQSELSAPYGIWQKLFHSIQRYPGIAPPPPPFVDPAALDTVGSAVELWGMAEAWLSGVAASRPVVLVLEDLHWADQSSLDLLRFLGRHAGDIAALIVATYRDADLTPGHPLYQRLPQLVREGRTVRLALRPLEWAATRDLIHDRYPALASDDTERLATYLEEHADGNPLFIDELLVMLEHEGVLLRDGDGWALLDLPAFTVPPLVRQMIDERLQRMSASALGLLQIAAVIGVEVPYDLWQAASGASEDELAGVLEESLAARILSEMAGSDLLRFHHTLIHNVVYESLNLMRRVRWHRTIGELLAAQPNVDPSVVAHHFTRANDSRAARWLIEAGRLATRASALHAMIDNYKRALALLEHDPEHVADSAWLLCALAEAHRYTDTAQALSYVTRAVVLAKQLDDPAIGVLAIWCQARIRNFDDQNALDALQSAASAFAALSPDERQRLETGPLGYVVSEATLAQDLANCGQFVDAKRHAEHFLETHAAPSSRAKFIEFGNAHFGLGIACAALGEAQRARAAFEHSRRYFRDISNFQMVSNSCYWELNALLQVYDTEQPAIRHQRQEEEVQANARSQFVQPPKGGRRVSTSDTLILDGDWDDCWSSASARLNIPASRIPSARKLADIEWLRGNLERAMAHIRTALPAGPDEAPGRRFFLHRHELQRIAAEIALDEGNDALAERWIEALERWIAWSGKVSGQATPHLLRARLLERRNDLDGARRHAEQALELATSPRQPLELLRAHRALAGLSARAGNLDMAERHLREALAIADACDAPYAMALTRVVQAELLPRVRPGEQVRQSLAEAKAIAERLAARPLLERIARLDAPAAPPLPVPAPATGGLSPREADVLRLVAQGMTDIQIAKTLSISPRTVSGHLQSIYNKLGVNTRTAAVAFAFEHGLVGA